MADADGYLASQAFKRLARFMSNLSSEEIEALATGQVAIELVAKRRAPRSRESLGEGKIREIVRTLSSFDSRDEGYEYLIEVAPTRANLERIAVALDLPIERRDTSERLRHRVVETTIGYRLRSEAIHGKLKHEREVRPLE